MKRIALALAVAALVGCSKGGESSTPSSTMTASPMGDTSHAMMADTSHMMMADTSKMMMKTDTAKKGMMKSPAKKK